MTRDDIMRMALEAGGCTPDGGDLWELHENSLVLFYAFAAAEKEARMIRDGYRQCAEGQRTTQYCGLLDAAVKAEREKVAAWMRSKSYATGHGDTVEDLLKELEWQVAEREREACAKICDGWASYGVPAVAAAAQAIRARGET